MKSIPKQNRRERERDQETKRALVFCVLMCVCGKGRHRKQQRTVARSKRKGEIATDPAHISWKQNYGVREK